MVGVGAAVFGHTGARNQRLPDGTSTGYHSRANGLFNNHPNGLQHTPSLGRSRARRGHFVQRFRMGRAC